MYAPGAEQIGLRFWKRWIASGREVQADRRDTSTQWVLVHGWRYRATFFLSFTLFSAAYILAFVAGDSFAKDPAWKRLSFNAATLGIAALNLYLALSAFLDRVALSETEISIHRLALKDFIARWDEIAGAAPNAERSEAVFTAVDGSKRAVSLYMNGLGTLREFLERRVPRERWSGLDELLPHPHSPSGEPWGRPK